MKQAIDIENIGFIDIHYHAMPDLYTRRHNAIEAGNIYKKLNGAVVLKSHLGSTCVQATIAQELGLPVFPSVGLNAINGGIHYRNVQRALLEYKPVIPSKVIVDLPTITGRNHSSKLSRNYYHPELGSNSQIGETIFDDQNNVRQEVIDVLKMSKDYPIVISSGHASKKEIYALIELCIQYNIQSFLLNQPANPMSGFNAQELIELNKFSFLWIEQTALTFLLSYQNHDDFKETLLNVKNLIYSSDLGQTTQPEIDQWLNNSSNWFTNYGINLKRRDQICLRNPYQMILM